MYGWYGWGLFSMENVIIMYLSIGESSFKITLRLLVFTNLDRNLGSHTG